MRNVDFYVEDALWIYGKKLASVEAYDALTSEKDWTGIRPDVLKSAKGYDNSDELVDFALYDKAAYAKKVGSVEGKADSAFPVLVVVRKLM